MTRKNIKKPKNDLKDHTINTCNHTLHGKHIHKPLIPKEDILHIQTYNNAITRQILVPTPAVKCCPELWPRTQYNYIKKQSHVQTKADKLAIIEEAQVKHNLLAIESFQRKEALEEKKLSQRAVPRSKLYNEEDAAAARSLYLLQRALNLRIEQEDDIKYANGVIFLAKCGDIRKQQIAEKNLMKKELQEEENRLDQMMEQERQKKVKEEEAKTLKRKEASKKAFEAQMEQIQEHEQNKIVEEELKREENRLIMKRIAQMKEEDEENLRKKRLEQQAVRENLNKANAELMRIKAAKKEEEVIGNCRIEEFIKAKAKQDAEYQSKVDEKKAEQIRKTAILQALQEKVQGDKASADELKAKKVQRECERERRENERLAEQKRKKLIEDLKKGRAHQLEDINKTKGLEKLDELSHINKSAKLQNEMYENDIERARIRKEAAMQNRKELLQQIHSQEIDRINQIKNKFEEGFTLKYKMEAHDINIQNILRKKMQRLHEENTPEYVIKDIERTLRM